MKLRYTVETCPPAVECSSRLYIAAKIALKYAGKVPRAEDLRRDFGMSTSTSNRWRRAFMDALGVYIDGRSQRWGKTGGTDANINGLPTQRKSEATTEGRSSGNSNRGRGLSNKVHPWSFEAAEQRARNGR